MEWNMEFCRVAASFNKQIKKESGCYTPACEWPAAIFSQAYVPQPAPIIMGVMFLFGNSGDLNNKNIE